MRLPDGRAVKFDGCAVWDPKRQLLAQGRQVEWHAADRRYRDVVRDAIVEDLGPQPGFSLDHTPAR